MPAQFSWGTPSEDRRIIYRRILGRYDDRMGGGGTGSGSCLMAGFGISGIKPSYSVTIQLLILVFLRRE